MPSKGRRRRIFNDWNRNRKRTRRWRREMSNDTKYSDEVLREIVRSASSLPKARRRIAEQILEKRNGN